MMKFLAFAFFALAASAQTVADVADTAARALTNNTVALTVTASSGDGSTCTITKNAGGAINASLSCTSGDGKTAVKSGTLRSSGTAALSMPFGAFDVLCLLVVNPTASAVTLGSVGPAPANGLAWSCTTNIRTSGTVSGQTQPVNGSVNWP